MASIVAALLALLSIAGFVHAFRTPKDKTLLTPERADSRAGDESLVGV